MWGVWRSILIRVLVGEHVAREASISGHIPSARSAFEMDLNLFK
jgi:hypothetical protein